jgi:hypothetical protein
MNSYELYINKQLIDLETKFTFGLIYQSPVFTDISKIAGNRTTTVKIPKTANNLRVIENCQMPDNTTSFPYEKRSVELWKNGIPLIQNGTMILLSINDYIELSVIWGSGADAAILQNTKLRELDGTDYVQWYDGPGNRITGSNKDYGFARAFFGITSTLNSPFIRYIHPFVSLDWILGRIALKTMKTLLYPPGIAPERAKIYIPLTDKNADENTFADCDAKFSFAESQEVTIDKVLDMIEDEEYGINRAEIYIIGKNFIEIRKDCRIYITGSCSFTMDTVTRDFALKITVNDNDEIEFNVSSPGGVGNKVSFDLTEENTSISVKSGDTVKFKFHSNEPAALDIKCDGVLYIHPEPESKTTFYGAHFPVIPNLPDITCLDFIKTFMLLFGLFAGYDTEGNGDAIRFFSVDEIYDRKPDAKDWTDKLVTGSRIENITFTFQDYAQANRIRYLEDETVKVNADGYIEVSNQTLEREKDIAELKFAASDEIKNPSTDLHEDIISIPLYLAVGEVEAEYQKLSLRMALMEFGEEDSIARFPEEMYFGGASGRIATYYKKYREILLRPKVIEATFLLNETDLYNIDLLTPVYLEQTGQYYAIIDINASEKGAKCKLLQM